MLELEINILKQTLIGEVDSQVHLLNAVSLINRLALNSYEEHFGSDRLSIFLFQPKSYYLVFTISISRPKKTKNTPIAVKYPAPHPAAD